MAIASPAVRCDVVVPTIGRPSLDALLGALAAQADDLPGRVILVDDRREPCEVVGTLQDRVPAALAASTTVCTSGGTGPAAARNCGWRASDTPWIAFLDDDVVPGVTWARDLVADLACAPSHVAAVAGIIDVPLPAHRLPTDRERNVARL